MVGLFIAIVIAGALLGARTFGGIIRAGCLFMLLLFATIVVLIFWATNH